MNDKTLQAAVKARRDLHQIPEPGFGEFKTQAYILKFLRELGLSPFEIAQTGVACFFDYHKEKTVAFRSDIDALPVTEESSCEFVSGHPGFMHACGHDGHTAMLLGFAHYLATEVPPAAANVLLIFQPAEEGPGGAEEVIKEGIFKTYNVARIYGYHVFPDYPFGKTAVRAGEFFANSVELYIEVTGASAHGAKQHLGKDALLAACSLTMSLHTLVNKIATPYENAALNLGYLQAGDRLNVVAGHANLQGTLRTYNSELRDRIIQGIFDMCEGTAMAYGVDIVFRPVYFYPALVNDETLYEEAKRILSPIEAVKEMVAEDFSYYSREVPSLFMLLGTDDGKPEHQHPLHSSRFDFDDSVLAFGIESYAKLILEIEF